ncbi:MAG: 3-hydroxyacyl-CoA dehydrogenase [Anaerolineales bacterium]|nr:3-hydroxyacyl-CoA dehydrogenase [Anaerolineales bacterium]
MMEVHKIAVIGAGTMGRGIAQVSAMAGFQVNIVDVDDTRLKQADKKIKENLQKGVDLGKIDTGLMETSLQRLSAFTDLPLAVQDVDLVIESVPEDLLLKQSIFRKCDEVCPTRTILATNTSTMSPGEIGSITKRPHQVIAMHFFNPVHLMKLVEVIRSLDTADETLAVVLEVSAKMGKETVVVNESPGFITSRISALVGNEAFYMLMEGVASAADIDRAIKLGLNYPMGPLELADLVGLDVRLRNLQYLHQTLGEKFRPCPLLIKYVQAGRLGRKSGRGVYEYRNA